MTAHSWILLLVLLGLGKLFGVVPFEQEIRQAIAYALPWTPWIIMAIILSRAAGGAVNTVTTWVDKLIGLIAAIIYGIFFTILVVPVMVADTFLLGPIAMWAWKHTSLLILSVVINGFVYWFLTTTPLAIPKKYIAGALVLNVSMIFVLYLSQWLLNAHWIEFKVKNGVFLPNPVVSIDITGGDTVRFVTLGYNIVPKIYPGIGAVDEVYPPEGLSGELYPDPAHPGWDRPDGEIQLLVMRPDGSKTVVLVRDIETGPGQIFGFNFKDLVGGYYISGKADIPDGTMPGRLGVEFFNISPDDGQIKMTIIHNLDKSLLGRLAMGFILRDGFKHFVKKDYIVGGRVLYVLFALGMLATGIVQYGRKPEGLHVHWGNIVGGIAMLGAVWFVIELFINGTSPRMMVEDIWGWFMKKQ